MEGRDEMKKGSLLILLLMVGVSLAFRVTQGIDEAQRAVVKAFEVGARDKAPYLYSKTRSYKEISTILASEADDVGSKVFAIRTMNYASKAISAAFIGAEELTPLETPKFEGKEGRDFTLVDLEEIRNRLEFLRNNRGMNCSPKELGRAEAFYDALVYELSKEEPNSALVLRFYNEVNTVSRIAESKLKVAIENELECYTGRKKVVAVPPPEERPPEVAKKPPEEKKPKLVEEPLKITARIHFDFDKYNIKREYIPILNEVVKTLKENPFVKVRIEGYTDIIGPKDYNVRLAYRRALSVKNYLVKHGIPEEKIEIVGFGKERFIATNRTSIGRLTNRRVEFIVIRVQEE
jgi:outer membrane protein OmpA-like peptidoglycan-associated protein